MVFVPVIAILEEKVIKKLIRKGHLLNDMETWCLKCERLMVDHPNGVFVCLGCEGKVQVKQNG